MSSRFTVGKAPPEKLKPYRLCAPDARALNVLGDKWTLLILRELVDGPVRFTVLQDRLGISTEQLRFRLACMVRDGLLTRERFREVPPRVDYGLTDAGRDALPVVAALAEWGARWRNGPPRDGETVDEAMLARVARCGGELVSDE